MGNADRCLHKHTQGTRLSAFDHYGWSGAAGGYYVHFLPPLRSLIDSAAETESQSSHSRGQRAEPLESLLMAFVKTIYLRN